MPAYNAAEFLEAAVERLLSQTLDDFEVIVVDDGSMDATPQRGALLTARHPQLRFFRLPQNGGVAQARAFGVQQSRGRFIWFVDADVSAPPTALTALYTAAQSTGADLVVAAARLYTRGEESSRMISPPVFSAPISGASALRSLLTGQITGHLWNKLVRREVFDGIEFTPAEVHSDLALMGQLLAASATVTVIPDVVYAYRLRTGSVLHSDRHRAESLRLVEFAMTRAARQVEPPLDRTSEFRYFLLRFIVLSGMKDALVSDYDRHTRQTLIRNLRLRLRWRDVLVLVYFRDARRLLLAVSAKCSLWLHRRILRAAGRRG